MRLYKKGNLDFIKRVIVFIIFTYTISALYSQEPLHRADVISVVQLVNDYWIDSHPDPGDNGWARSAYFTGNMAAYDILPQQKYLDYALFWAEQNHWAPASLSRNADDHCCGQTYIDLFKIETDTSRIIQIKQIIDGMVDSEKCNDWFWVDALFMDMPVFARLGALYHDKSYFSKMYDLYIYAKTTFALYDPDDRLWFRDLSWSGSEDTTSNGEKIFWSRGNGWAFGALVQVLQLLPEDDIHRDEYLTTYVEMASALSNSQRSDGFWGVNLADNNHYPGPETSGTCFFTYGLAWGIHNGILDSAIYYPVVLSAWNGLISTSVHPDGFLGYVQGSGSHPGSSQPVTTNSTADFGVGAFLLACSEVFKLADGEFPASESENFALYNLMDYSSQQTDPFNPASNAVDGNEATRWSANGFPQWIEIDLKEIKKINKTTIIPYMQRAYQYMIQAKKNDDDSYFMIVDRQDNTAGGNNIIDTFETIDARYVKFTIAGCSDYTGDWVSICEFKIFGNIDTEVNLPKKLDTIKGPDLFHAYPNPFNSSTTILFSLSKSTSVSLKIYNLLGKEVETLISEYYCMGIHKVEWNAKDLPSGIYLYRLEAGNNVETKKLILQK